MGSRPTKGQKTPGSGRKKGTLNKRTLAEEACHKLGISPFELLAQMCINGEAESTRLAAIQTLCKHIEPPKKPLEMSLNPEANELVMKVYDYTEDKK